MEQETTIRPRIQMKKSTSEKMYALIDYERKNKKPNAERLYPSQLVTRLIETEYEKICEKK